MLMLTLAEAAKQTGLTKPAIFKSIQKGRVSAVKDEKGVCVATERKTGKLI
jgi:excisionase family DNA binding protein